MAQLERLFQGTFNSTAADNDYHVVTGFPTIPANSVALVVGAYFYFYDTYANNITSLAVDDTANIVPVFLSSSGEITNNSTPIISSNSQFILNAGDVLQYKFTNDNPGLLDISIFYRLISEQDLSSTLKYSSIKSNESAPLTEIIIPSIGTLIPFYKSLIITNSSVNSDFEIGLKNNDGGLESFRLKEINIAQGTSSICILGNEYLFANPINELYIDTFSNDYSYYFSYYFDPLYKP